MSMQGDEELMTFIRKFMMIMGEHMIKIGQKQKAEGATDGSGSAAPSTATATGDLTEVSSRKLTPESEKASEVVKPPSTKEIVSAAAGGKLAGVDDDVRDVLSNPMLVEILRDPQMQRVLEECRMDGRRLRYYVGIPEVKARLQVLQAAGLIRIEL